MSPLPVCAGSAELLIKVMVVWQNTAIREAIVQLAFASIRFRFSPSDDKDCWARMLIVERHGGSVLELL